MDTPPGDTAAGVAAVAASTRGQLSPEQQQDQVTPDRSQHAAAAAEAEPAAAAGDAQTGARAAPSCRVPGCTEPLVQTYNQVCLQPSLLSSRGFGVRCRCLASPGLTLPAWLFA
jgi:hypothetical protein